MSRASDEIEKELIALSNEKDAFLADFKAKASALKEKYWAERAREKAETDLATMSDPEKKALHEALSQTIHASSSEPTSTVGESEAE